MEPHIEHPTLTPQEITAALGLAAQISHRVGAPRMTLKGTPLAGDYRDTRWRHSVEHTLHAQWFAKEVAALVERLKPHRAFLHELRATGGRAFLCLQFFDGHFSDAMPRDLLAALVDLDLDLGIEIF